MIKIWLKDLVLVLLFGFLALFLQSAIFPMIFKDKLELNLIFGLIIWLGFFKSTIPGALFSFILAYFLGAVSGTLSGVYMFAGMSLYLICLFSRASFSPKNLSGQIVFSFLLFGFSKLILLLALELFIGRNYFRVQPIYYILLEIALNALIAPFIFKIFHKIKGFFDLIPELLKPKRG